MVFPCTAYVLIPLGDSFGPADRTSSAWSLSCEEGSSTAERTVELLVDELVVTRAFMKPEDKAQDRCAELLAIGSQFE